MVQPEFTSPTIRVAAPKPRMTVYYAMLMLALMAMLIATLFMYLEFSRYRRENNGQAVPQRISAVERTQTLVQHDVIARRFIS